MLGVETLLVHVSYRGGYIHRKLSTLWRTKSLPSVVNDFHTTFRIWEMDGRKNRRRKSPNGDFANDLFFWALSNVSFSFALFWIYIAIHLLLSFSGLIIYNSFMVLSGIDGCVWQRLVVWLRSQTCQTYGECLFWIDQCQRTASFPKFHLPRPFCFFPIPIRSWKM